MILPGDLARRHPQLFHVTSAGAWPLIRKLGLLSASRAVALFEVKPADRDQLLLRPRPVQTSIFHPRFGTIILGDNSPLQLKALAPCLDDGLSPQDWLAMLNARVFFWADRQAAARLVNARANRQRGLELLVIDTKSLAQAYGDRMELSPINSGAALRKAARRGLGTFTPLSAMSYVHWQRRRGGRDRILEVVARDAVPDIARYVIAVEHISANRQTTRQSCLKGPSVRRSGP